MDMRGCLAASLPSVPWPATTTSAPLKAALQASPKTPEMCSTHASSSPSEDFSLVPANAGEFDYRGRGDALLLGDWVSCKPGKNGVAS